VRLVYQILAVLLFATALGWWVYSPLVDCDPQSAGGCGFFDFGLGSELGLVLNLGIVVLLVAAALSLWFATQKGS
jgi:hypothetical protein